MFGQIVLGLLTAIAAFSSRAWQRVTPKTSTSAKLARQLGITLVAGLLLGYVRVRTGTLLGSILFHVVWNGTIAAAMVWPAAAGVLEGIGPVHVAVAAVALVAGLAVLHRVARPAARRLLAVRDAVSSARGTRAVSSSAV